MAKAYDKVIKILSIARKIYYKDKLKGRIILSVIWLYILFD